MKILFCLIIALLGTFGFLAASDVLPVPTKEGTYTSGDWTYRYTIDAKGTRSERRTGTLTYQGAELKAPAGTILTTPFGRFMHFGEPEIKGWGERSWVNTQVYDRPVFKTDGKLNDDLARTYGEKVVEVDLARVLELSR